MASGQGLHDTWLIRSWQSTWHDEWRTRAKPHSARRHRTDNTRQERRQLENSGAGCQDSWSGRKRTDESLHDTWLIRSSQSTWHDEWRKTAKPNSTRRHRSDKTRQERRQLGNSGAGCQDSWSGIKRSAHYWGGKFKPENESGFRKQSNL